MSKKLVLTLTESEVDVILAALAFFCKYGTPKDQVVAVAADASKYLHEQNMAQVIKKGTIQ